MSRTKFAIKNAAAGGLSQCVSIVLGFILRTAFIHILGNQYLGINGLYSEVLSVLSFAELGFGTAFTYAMYKPVAMGDEKATAKLLNYYKKVYQIIALVISLLGLVMLAFLPYVIKGADTLSLFDLRIYYLIFLFNTVISYFVSYKFSFANANQKNYIVTNIEVSIKFFTNITQIIILIVFKNFLAYLLTQSFLLLVSRVIISLYLNKKFPILKNKCSEKLTHEEKAPIIRDIKGLILQRLSSIAIHSTDNIIISTFSGLGVVAVGLISNYNLLMSSVLGFVTIIFSSVSSGFGNMVASSETKNYHKTFLELNLLNFWMYGFCCIAFFVLVPPFIVLWIGPENLVDMPSFFLIVLNAYLMGQCLIYDNARMAKGHFSKDKWPTVFVAIINLIVSVICAKAFGLVGVYIGTIASRIVFMILRPLVTYKFMFNVSALEYYKRVLKYLLITFIVGALTYFSTFWVLSKISVLRFFIACIIVAIVPNLLFLVINFKTEEFKCLVNRFKTIITNIRKVKTNE